MGENWKPSSPWLRRKAKQGFRGYPVATIAFYGPTDTLATKIVVSIVLERRNHLPREMPGQRRHEMARRGLAATFSFAFTGSTS
jgi:hypothetical protein